jgi:hypothetical protein
MDLLSERRPVAQKDYQCDACNWIFNGDIGREFYEYDELRLIVRARRDKHKIKKGMRYVTQSLNDGGEIFTFRAREDMHDLCLKYDLYQD